MSGEPADSEERFRARFAELADRIETEVQRLRLADGPPPEGPVTPGTPGVTFGQWLQYGLCARLRAIAAGRSEPPPPRPAGTAGLPTYVVKNLDGYQDTERLEEAIRELDRLTGNI